MKRLLPDEAFRKIGCRYDKGMAMVRTGELDGTFYRIGRRVIFSEEKLDEWQERQLNQANHENQGIRMAQ